jgi:phosphoglycolate phosphatase
MDNHKKKLIMFDYDGVIVDSLDVFATTFLAASHACGYTGIKTHEQVVRLFDGNFFEKLAQLGLSSDKIDEILRDAYRRKVQKYFTEVRPFQGMQESLNALSGRNVLAVITSNDSQLVWQFLEKEGMACFDAVVGADQERSKVTKIRNIMARYQDLPAFYVGDTKGDMIEGRQAGAVTVAVTWGWHSVEKLTEGTPDYMVHSVAELEKRLS